MSYLRWRVVVPLLLTLLTLAPSARADGEDTSVPGQSEPIGTWRFRTDKPVKAVVVGGSVAAYNAGNFGSVLEEACRNVEVVNIAKARYGAWAMKKRFEAQVLKNRRLNLKTPGREHWAIILGGLNSVASPEKTSSELMKIHQLAHGVGMKVVGLTLSPWGSESDSRRWAGTAGLAYKGFTKKVVDFVMGRVGPAEALGRYAKGKEAWEAGDLPDVAVDLYDSPLRDATAALRPEDATARAVDRSPAIRRQLQALPEAERSAERERLIAEARALPRWYLREELHAFDTTHPNREGHRLIAEQACAKLPASWGCDCAYVAAKGQDKGGADAGAAKAVGSGVAAPPGHKASQGR